MKQYTSLWRLGWRSLARSPRVLFVSLFMLVLLTGSALLLRKMAGGEPIGFAYLIAFVPIIVLATVTQANLFGVDRGAALAALSGDLPLVAFARVKMATALGWSIGILTLSGGVGLSLVGGTFLPILSLQIGLAFLLSGLGGITSVLGASSRAYDRVSGQTAELSVGLPLSLLGLGYAWGAMQLLSGSVGGSALPASILLAAVLVWLGCRRLLTGLVASRREHVVSALQVAP